MFSKIKIHIAQHGIIGICCGLVFVFAMRGFDVRILIMTGLPLLLAFLKFKQNKSKIAESFLVCVGVAAIIAEVNFIFPDLGLNSKMFDRVHDGRLFALYLIIYLVYAFIVLPIHWFVGYRKSKVSGIKYPLSSFTCCSALFMSIVVSLGFISSMPDIFYKAGLSPIIKF